MNKHIELVKKWLANPESVTKEELDENYKSAYWAAWDADDYMVAEAAADWAANWAVEGDVEEAKKMG